MNEPSIILVCKKVRFFSRKDEDAFFGWIKSIECINDISAKRDELYLNIASIHLDDQDLRDLLALLYRYKIDMRQLRQFLNENNSSWFFNNKKAYWHTRVFGNQR